MPLTLKRLLCLELPRPGHQVGLPEGEASHAGQVLRLRSGDLVQAIDGKGGTVVAVLWLGGPTGPALEFHANGLDGDSKVERGPDSLPIRLEVAILKGEAMEWVVEKCVELGVDELVPVVTAHTVVQIDKKGPKVFVQRWQKIADQALKQCGRLTRLKIAMPVSLEQLLVVGQSDVGSAVRYWCDESLGSGQDLAARLNTGSDEGSVQILIGPEGGWSARERDTLHQCAAIPVTLGPLILRAETAVLYSVSLVVGQMRAQLSRLQT